MIPIKLKYLIPLIITMGWFNQSYSQKYAVEFLTTGVGARALGMGGAFIAIANDATAAYWNPAGLALLKQREITIMHASQFSGLVHSNFVNFVYPDHNGSAFGISWIRTGIDDIPKSTKLDDYNRPIIEGYMRDVEQALFFSYSRQITDRLSLGGNIKAIRQTIGNHSSLGFGLDLGTIYRLNSGLNLGINLQDLAGTYVFWNTGHRDVKHPTIKWGFSYTRTINRLSGVVAIAVNHNMRFEGESSESTFAIGNIAGSDFQYGAEYVMFDRIAIRLGIDRGNFTAGTGLKMKMLEIDYAFVSYELGNTHRISGRVKF